MLHKAFLILSGNAAAAVFLLARNLIIARLIPVADYGVAATFALAMSVVEMASALGLHQQIVQAKEGDDQRFQAALQGFQVLRGVISAVVLFALAGPFARFLDIPEVIWAYQLLAVVPILNALQHFDIHRLSRHMRFGPMLMTGSVAAVVAVVVAWPLAVWLDDWRAMLWSIIGQAAVGTLISHWTAERPYRLVWDREIMAQSLRFGWPLLVNAILMFLVFQGDKLIVSSELGMEAMAIFAMGVTLTLSPTQVLGKSAGNIFLPRLSRAAHTPEFTAMAQQALQSISLLGFVFVLFVLLFGGPVVSILLGPKYSALPPLLIWFALGQGLRFMKTGPSIIALAVGQTSNAMIANLVRVAGLPVAWIAVIQGGGLLEVLLISMIAEGLGLLVALAVMLARSSLPWPRIMMQQGMLAMMVILAGIWSYYRNPDALAVSWQVWVAGLAAIFVALLFLPELTHSWLKRRRR